MSKKIISTPNAPQPVGPYNQAAATDRLIYTSGQIALDPKTNAVCPGGITEQTRMVLNHLKSVLEAGGSSLEQVLKATVFLKNMNDFAAMNAVYSEYFNPKTAPARSTIEVARLPRDVLVEIEAVAVVG